MDLISAIIVVCGLCLFEIVSSIDNAIINADVLVTMSPRARRWFLFWGLLLAVFIIRGLLPWIIVWMVNPHLGPINAFTATLSTDPSVREAVERSAPTLLAGGGVFLIFLFLHWLFLEEKNYGLPKTERFFSKQGVWFFAVVSILLTIIVWFALRVSDMMAMGAVVGSTVFFITHGFKQNAEENEKKLLVAHYSDVSKLFYLEIIDATFSIDGVLGAFAFTLAIPLILVGNGIGALVVRQFTIKGMEKIKRYIYLKNGAMYSVFFLGIIMLLKAFSCGVPELISPLITFTVIGYFFIKSIR
jgi:hypothetical protein